MDDSVYMDMARSRSGSNVRARRSPLDAQWALILGLVAVAGIALRLYVERSSLGVSDSDEAIVGLMARHVLHGQLTTFFWGQGYGGSQEAIVTAPVIAVLGSSWLALRLVPIALSAVAAVVVWRVGRRTIGEPAATVAGGVIWLWPPYLIYEISHQFGFYASGVVYAALLLLLALRAVERPDRNRAAMLGFVLGLSLWNDIQLVPLMAGVIVWTVLKRRQILRHAWLAILSAALGAAPWLVWNLRHNWGSLGVPADTSPYEHRLRIFFSPLLPMLLGLREPFTQRPLIGALLTDLAYLLLIALAAYGAYRTRRRNTSLLYTTAVVFPIVYAISPQTLFEMEPRYLLTLAPTLTLIIAQFAQSKFRSIVVLALTFVVSAITLQRMDEWVGRSSADPQFAPRSTSPLIRALTNRGIRSVYGNYWIAYRLDFQSGERIVAAENNLLRLTFRGGRAYAAHDPDVRWEPFERAVNRDANHAFVFFQDDRTASAQARERTQRLLSADGYVRERVGAYLVYLKPGSHAPPS